MYSSLRFPIFTARSHCRMLLLAQNSNTGAGVRTTRQCQRQPHHLVRLRLLRRRDATASSCYCYYSTEATAAPPPTATSGSSTESSGGAGAGVEPAPNEYTAEEAEIYNKLAERFKPSQLQVQDVSGGCGAFFAITIASKDFAGMSTIKQHRLVNDALKEKIAGIHGLQLKTIVDTT